MNERFRVVAEFAAGHHNVIGLTDRDRLGVSRSQRHQWIASGRLARVGPRSFSCAGCALTWEGLLGAGLRDLDGVGSIGGRSAARLNRLDSFIDGPLEFVVRRTHRRQSNGITVRATNRPFGPGDIITVDGLRTTSAQRTILDAALFGFSRAETENAIDSAIRTRRVSEQRLRSRTLAQHSRGMHGGRALLDALIDTGGESMLERRFLALFRHASIERPTTQRVFRDGTRTIARVYAFFSGSLVVEVAGHGTHATRSQRQIDAQRHTELTLLGLRVLTFTYEDVMDRPEWLLMQLRRAL